MNQGLPVAGWGFHVAGWGSALPGDALPGDALPGDALPGDKGLAGGPVPSAEYERRLGLDPGWIEDRTGIRNRYQGCGTRALAVHAARSALARSGGPPPDLVIVATTTPDRLFPGVATDVAGDLGLEAGTLDVNSACTGSVHALLLAFGALATGMARRVLVIAADAMSAVTCQEERSTAVLFGDAAAAIVLDAGVLDAGGPPGSPAGVGAGRLLGVDTGSAPGTVDRLWATPGGPVHMIGREVMKRAVDAVTTSADRAMQRSYLAASDIALFVPHQSNLRMMEAMADGLGIDRRRMLASVVDTGNTGAATVLLALARHLDTAVIPAGSPVLIAGYGAGMTWASAVITWPGTITGTGSGTGT